MLQILPALSLGPFDAFRSPVFTQISAFGEHHEPHWLQPALTTTSPPRQLAKPTGESWSISLHIPRHEYEAGQAQTEAYKGDVQD